MPLRDIERAIHVASACMMCPAKIALEHRLSIQRDEKKKKDGGSRWNLVCSSSTLGLGCAAPARDERRAEP